MPVPPPLPARLLLCMGGHVEIGLAPRPTNTTTAVGRGLAGHAMCITGIGCFASPGGGGRRLPAPRGRGMVATPLLCAVVAAASVFPWHPRAYARRGQHCGRRSSRKWSLCQYWPRSHRRPPPLAPRGCPAARGCGSGRNGRAITELASWHDINIAHVV